MNAHNAKRVIAANMSANELDVIELSVEEGVYGGVKILVVSNGFDKKSPGLRRKLCLDGVPSP